MTRKIIGQRVVKEMKKKSLSFYKLAKDAGISITQLKSITSASSNYTIDSILNVCKALDINVMAEEPVC